MTSQSALVTGTQARRSCPSPSHVSPTQSALSLTDPGGPPAQPLWCLLLPSSHASSSGVGDCLSVCLPYYADSSGT